MTALESGFIVAKEQRASAGIPAAFRWPLPLEAALKLELAAGWIFAASA